MKRVFLLLTTIVLLLSFCGCKASVSQEDAESTLAQFTDALKIYDREAMSALLTEFPDKTLYVYLDDIFNDEKYIELYRLLYTDITYAVKSYENNRMTVEFTMPNVQKMYTNVSALILNLALTDEELVSKLEDGDENGIILIQEMMLALAKQDGGVETMTQQFTLSFTYKGEKNVIVCDDELRALITGNFFLSKNSTLAEVNAQSN